ncbi:tumor necrosis factor receptor superfamily member 10A isoform X2 [Melopsittacus undulatus]|uniref:tumor necrosis factor receptor superfamily member 10A isoform X2 n=1 Tax=Melopsittacus undulatus TaxID=13146 RepID=UPI00146B02AC|nr:tumor necrosis factor receptor superfamily member 10A isoform X2 [Melopsittacus undulatus]
MPYPRTSPEPCPEPLSAPLRCRPRTMRPLLLCAPRRRCPTALLVLLVLLTEVPLGTAASALHRRDKVDLSDAHRGEDEFYPVPNSNIYCRKCPAGTYVAEHCKEQNGFSKCLPCKDNEYIKYPNGLLMCFDCRTCREDEVQLSPCRAVQDTQCACRNGTFCSPEHPCEMCQKCRPRCPNGEVELAPCTSSSDRRCGPPTTTHSLSTTWIVIIVVVIVVFVVLFFICVYCCCCRSTGDRRDLSGKPCSMMDYLLQRLTRFQNRRLGTQDNRHNESLFQDPLLPSNPAEVSPSAPGAEVMVPRTSQPTVKPRKKLVPVEGVQPYECAPRPLEEVRPSPEPAGERH